MLPIRHGIANHFSRRLQPATYVRPLLVCSRSLHGQTSESEQRRQGKLKAYAGSAIVLGLLSLSVLWAVYPSSLDESAVLHERIFHPFTLISKDAISPSSSIFTVRPAAQPTTDPYADLWRRSIWSVEFKQPQLQIARSYTPLPPPPTAAAAVAAGDLRFLIRKEHKGEVSTYLDRLRVGALIDIRGPRVEYEIPDGVSEVLFLAGGTGIAPALQVVRAVLGQHEQHKAQDAVPRIRVMWANRRREDCIGGGPPVQTREGWWWSWLWSSSSSQPVNALNQTSTNPIVRELQDLERESQGRLQVTYVVDEERTYVDKSTLLKGIRDTDTDIVTEESPRKKIIFVSGPDGFVHFFAGPKAWRDGKEVQGLVEGLLGGLGLSGWTVVKL